MTWSVMQRDRGKEKNSKERGGWPPSMRTEHRCKASVTGRRKRTSSIRGVFKPEVTEDSSICTLPSLRYWLRIQKPDLDTQTKDHENRLKIIRMVNSSEFHYTLNYASKRCTHYSRSKMCNNNTKEKGEKQKKRYMTKNHTKVCSKALVNREM